MFHECAFSTSFRLDFEYTDIAMYTSNICDGLCGNLINAVENYFLNVIVAVSHSHDARREEQDPQRQLRAHAHPI